MSQVMIEQSSVAIVAFDSSDQQGIVWLSKWTKTEQTYNNSICFKNLATHLLIGILLSQLKIYLKRVYVCA